MHRQGCRGLLRSPVVCLSLLLGLLVACAAPLRPQSVESPPPAPASHPAQPAPASRPVQAQETLPVLRIEAGMHTAPIWRIDVDAQERFLVTASHDKTARVWSLASGELLQVLRPPLGKGNQGKLYAVASAPDGETVAVAGWTGDERDRQASIYLFDRASSRLQRQITGLPNVINHLAYSPDGRYLVAALGEGGIRVYDTRDLSEILRDSDYGDASYWAEFDRRGRLVTSCRDGYMRLYNASLQRLAQRTVPGGKLPFAVRFSPDGTKIVVGFVDTIAVNVLSGEDLSLLYTPDTRGVDNEALFMVAWSQDGRLLYASGEYNRSGTHPILEWSQAGRGPFTTLPASTNMVMGLRPLADRRLVFGAQDPAFGIFDAGGSLVLTRGPATVDYRGRETELHVSHDALIVEFGFDTHTANNRWSHHLAQLRLIEGRLLFDAPSLAALKPPHTTGLAISDWYDSDTPKLNGKPLSLEQYETSRRLAIAPDDQRFLLGTEWYLRLFDREGQQVWEVPAPSTTWAVNISGDGRLAVAAFGDGTLRWYRLRDGAELLALFVHPDGQRWVLWTPEGFFHAAPGSETLIGYHLNQGPDAAGEFISVEQMYNLFYRPELVARRLEEGIEPVLREALAKIGDVRQVLAAGLPPELELVSPPESQQRERDFTLAFKITPKNGGVGRVEYRVNDKVVGDPTARPVDIAVPYQRRPFTLLPGRNVLRVTVYNDKGTIESKPIEAVVHVQADERRPALYVLAIGVTNYRDRALNLRYAASDAEEFMAALQSQGQRLFTSVTMKALLDRNAGLSNIDTAFRELAGKVQEHDVFVLYLAGHGTTLDGQYHFLPWDLVYENQQALRTGSVHQERFLQWLGMIKAQKSLIVLDTCHAGAFAKASLGRLTNAVAARGGDLAEKGAMDRLMRATGSAVIAASSEQQMALEGYEGHGVFTYAMLRGLYKEADTDGDGVVTVDELAAYVAKEVPRMTMEKWQYEQFPMRDTKGQSFPISLVRP